MPHSIAHSRARAIGWKRPSRWHPFSAAACLTSILHAYGHRNLAAALPRNVRDATRVLPLLGITSP